MSSNPSLTPGRTGGALRSNGAVGLDIRLEFTVPGSGLRISQSYLLSRQNCIDFLQHFSLNAGVQTLLHNSAKKLTNWAG